jgi:GTPase SAR1 family protein
VVGNKKDLDSSRQVSFDEGKRFALSCGSAHYIETSAKTQTNLHEVFATLVKEIRKNKRLAAKKEARENGNEPNCFFKGILVVIGWVKDIFA